MIFLRKRTLDWKNFFAQKNKKKVFLQNKRKAKQLSAINRTSVFFVEETDLKKKISSSNYRQTPPPSCHYDHASVYWNSIEEENIILTSFLSKKKEKRKKSFQEEKNFFPFQKILRPKQCQKWVRITYRCFLAMPNTFWNFANDISA